MTRININDLEVFNPQSETTRTGSVDYKPVNKQFFTLHGNHDFIKDDNPCVNEQANEYHKLICAKKVGHKYYIRMNQRQEIYNPMNITHTNAAEKMDNNLPVWKYVNVAYSCFAHYLHFLKTKQEAYLTLTRREIGNVT